MIGASVETAGSTIRAPEAVFVQRRFNRKNYQRLELRDSSTTRIR